MFLQDLFGTHSEKYTLPVAVATAGTESDAPAFVMPFNATITAVTLVSLSGITGADTNSVEVNVVVGTTAAATLDFVDGVDATASVETAITLSATAADLDVDAGEVVFVDIDKPGTGLAIDGLVTVYYKSRGV